MHGYHGRVRHPHDTMGEHVLMQYVKPTPDQASKMIRQTIEAGVKERIEGDYNISLHSSVQGVQFWAICSIEIEDETDGPICTYWMKPFADNVEDEQAD